MLNGKAGVFKFLRFEKRFRKASLRFPRRISVNGRPNRENKAAFSNTSGREVWTGPQLSSKYHQLLSSIKCVINQLLL